MRKRAAATSRFVRPSATNRAIRRSASVSSPFDGARPPMRVSSTRVCSAQSGAPRRSKRASALSSVVRAGAPLGPPLGPSERKERPRMVKRIGASRMLGKRALEAPEGTSTSPRAARTSPRHRENRKCPCSVERGGPAIPCSEDLVGFVELPDCDQGLEQVAELQALRGLEHEGVAQLVCASEVRKRPAAPVESSRKPRTQLWPDVPMPIPLASAWATAPETWRAPLRFGHGARR